MGHTLQVGPPYSLHPFHEHENRTQCRIPVVEGDHVRCEDRTFAMSEHDSDQNNCKDLVLVRSFHHTDS